MCGDGWMGLNQLSRQYKFKKYSCHREHFLLYKSQCRSQEGYFVSELCEILLSKNNNTSKKHQRVPLTDKAVGKTTPNKYSNSCENLNFMILSDCVD